MRSDALIVFNPKRDADDPAADSTPSVFSKAASSLKNDHSFFTWADKGQWETVQATDENTKREATWFRIGFEPLFADFTKAGSWFIVYTLVEVREGDARLVACLLSGNQQLVAVASRGLFCNIQLHTGTLLVFFRGHFFDRTGRNDDD